MGLRPLTAAMVAAGVAMLVAGPVAAHPGRLDATGCHEVRTRFVHKNGRVDEPGSRHCHRKLGEGLALDGREQLQDRDAPEAAPAEDRERRPAPALR